MPTDPREPTPTPSGPSVERALTRLGLNAPVIRIDPLSGGVSNLTYRVDRQGAPPVVLRLQRHAGIFDPYDVLREARVLQALAASPIPVPAILAVQADPVPLGTPFFVMALVDAPHMGAVPLDARLLDHYVATVAAIHALPVAALGLDFLLPPDPPLPPAAAARAAVVARAERHGVRHVPLIDELDAWLQRHAPPTPQRSLCQGDINVYNYLVRHGQIVAVVDWEQAWIGDPLADIGLLAALAYLRGAGGPPQRLPLVARYLALTGRDAAALPYWTLQGLFNLAVIHRIWERRGPGHPWYAWDDVEVALATLRSARDRPERGP